jgi:hypothetical protein
MQFYVSVFKSADPILRRTPHRQQWRRRLFAAMQQYGANARLASQIAQDW